MSINRFFDELRSRRALLVGDLVLDSYLYGETVRVSREAPVLVVRKERAEHRLGGAANTAANLAALGLTTEVIGVIGQDEGGRRIVDMLGTAGAAVFGVESSRTTPVKTRVLAGAFGTSRQQVLRIDEEPDGQLSNELVAKVADDVARRAQGADVVVVSDYGYGLAAEPLLTCLRDLVKQGVPVCVDSRYQFRAFAGVTAITPNVPEAEALVAESITTQQAVERAGQRLLRELGCRAALVTQGRSGMTLFRPGIDSAHVDIVGDDEVADVTGAGDTVIATFSAALAAGVGMENGMRLANLAAGIVVGKVGTGTASPEEITHNANRFAVELLPWGR